MSVKPIILTQPSSGIARVRFLAILLVLAIFLTSCQVAEDELPRLVDVPVANLLAKARQTEPKIIPVTNVSAKSIGSIGQDPSILPLYFWPQEGTPAYLANFSHPEAGCKWLGVAGQVFDPQGNPIKNLAVIAGKVTDNLAAEQAVVSSGNTTIYGPQGYEIVLGDTPEDTTGTWYIQLSTLSGTFVSDRVFVQTSADCQKNLILLNFQQKETRQYWFPLVNR